MTRDDVLSALKRKPVPFEDSGLSCHLRPLTAADLSAMNAWQEQHGAESNYQWLFVRSVCDDEGVRIFTDDDATAVAELDGRTVNAVCRRIIELNGMGGGDAAGKDSSPSGTN